MKVHEVTCLNFWAFCKWHMWHFDFTGYIFVFSFYFACLASSPRQKTYLHLSPQSRLFPGILSVVMVLPSVILTHAWACLSLSSGHMEPSRGQVKPGAWPQHALRVRAGVHPKGPRPASGAQKAASFWRACHGAAGPVAVYLVSLLGCGRSWLPVQSDLSLSPLSSWWCTPLTDNSSMDWGQFWCF